ncbi:hypothetical protein KL86DES1_20452 [uncultured Desulfovibrio sp.]|uniref:Uncharacterized protein n=1 Tax=uncultured Desulfovibrio sp. TaxID=167968 RepID=A0A212L3R8_9BACT|nr:hypothetical protein KL86DES1_20452 [uncultured Desulfovibrio sp.]
MSGAGRKNVRPSAGVASHAENEKQQCDNSGGENKYQKEDAERNLQQSGIAIPAAATGL